MNTFTKREQKLVDIMFQIAQFSSIYFIPKDGDAANYYEDDFREKHMEWVAEQLRKCGFDTQPMGSSWGVLKNETK